MAQTDRSILSRLSRQIEIVGDERVALHAMALDSRESDSFQQARIGRDANPERDGIWEGDRAGNENPLGGKTCAGLSERANIAHDRPCERNLIVASDVVNATAERSGVNER